MVTVPASSGNGMISAAAGDPSSSAPAAGLAAGASQVHGSICAEVTAGRATRVARTTASARIPVGRTPYSPGSTRASSDRRTSGHSARTIEKYAPFISHYHTAGVPGRHELDENQELYYPRIARAIAGTGFTGFVAHEFMPTRDGLAKLQEAERIFAGA